MSRSAEVAVVQHLLDPEALRYIVDEGLPEQVIPTEGFRPVVVWALEYYYRSGCRQAPSVQAMRDEFTADLFDDHNIDLDEAPEDTVEWAVETLKGNWTLKQSQDFVKRLATDVNEAQTGERLRVLHEAVNSLSNIAVEVSRKSQQVDARYALAERIRAYEERSEAGHTVQGLLFGMDEIDSHTGGIHPGELAVIGAGPKTGKSFFHIVTAFAEWRRGRAVALFTLENSVEMTIDRLACYANGISPTRWLQGQCHPREEESIRGFREQMEGSDTPLWVIQPPVGRRGVAQMVREAGIRDADSMLIDQLTFIEPRDERLARYLQVREVMHDLKSLISTSQKRLPCLLAHQVNREGVKESRKVGYLRMEHLAEGSEVERTADFVFGLHQSDDEQMVNMSKLQMLASRRTALRHWNMNWHIEQGLINVHSQLTLEL
jgi:replicative DNA helicase